MVLGMSLATYTTVHVIISLIGIASGFIVLFGLLTGRLLGAMERFVSRHHRADQRHRLRLSQHQGDPRDHRRHSFVDRSGHSDLRPLWPVISSGAWRRTYVIAAMIALYFNVFVLVAQLFEHVPAIHALAPTQTEGPFKIAQLASLDPVRCLHHVPLRKSFGRCWHRRNSGIDTVQRSGKWDGFADVLEAADPRDGALDAHAEAGVRNAIRSGADLNTTGKRRWADGGLRCAASSSS